jgi:hypothetical protein
VCPPPPPPPIASTILLYCAMSFVLYSLVRVLATATQGCRMVTSGRGVVCMCRVVTCTRVPPTVKQRQPRAAVKEAEGYHRRACASKRSLAIGGLGLSALRRTSQPRPAMPHGANGSTKHKEAFSKHLQARQGPNAFALRLHVRPNWFWGRYIRDLAAGRLYFSH